MEEIKKIEWSDSYLIGVQEIDLQHKKLISIANELYDVVAGEEENYKEKMPKILKKLTDYTEYHFNAEEQLQKRIGYSGLDAHKMAHSMFIGEVNNQIRHLSLENKANVLGFYTYMVNWILTHVAKADKVWAKFMTEKK